jgi:hypothetical protein
MAQGGLLTPPPNCNNAPSYDYVIGNPLTTTDYDAAKAGYRSADIDVRKLPVGQYAALLTVDGVPATTQKVLINR